MLLCVFLSLGRLLAQGCNVYFAFGRSGARVPLGVGHSGILRRNHDGTSFTGLNGERFDKQVYCRRNIALPHDVKITADVESLFVRGHFGRGGIEELGIGDRHGVALLVAIILAVVTAVGAACQKGEPPAGIVLFAAGLLQLVMHALGNRICDFLECVFVKLMGKALHSQVNMQMPRHAALDGRSGL